MRIQMFQRVVQNLLTTTDRCFGIIDSNGKVIACSAHARAGKLYFSAVRPLQQTDDVVVAEGISFQALPSPDAHLFEFAVFCQGEDDEAVRFCTILKVALEASNEFYRERYDNAAFIHRILTGNIYREEIENRISDHTIEATARRVVFLIRQIGNAIDASVQEVLLGMFPNQSSDFIVNINASEIAVVKEIERDDDADVLIELGNQISQTINTELFIPCAVGISKICRSIKDLSEAYQEAQTALLIGQTFHKEDPIVSYERLGLGRLIYQLAVTPCDLFLAEIFNNKEVFTFDEEILDTILKFFENGLNVSETSRKLFIHRNTLVYRLDKIRRVTGLDLREFDQAVTFKIALMVRSYLDYKKTE